MILRRSDRRKVHDNRTRRWAARSVWSEVCARDLGLIVAPVTPSTSCARETGRGDRRCETIVKLLGKQESKRETRFYKLQGTNSSSTLLRSVQGPGGRSRNLLYLQRRFVERDGTTFVGKSSQASPHFRRNKIEVRSESRRTVVYNPFNVFRSVTDRAIERGLENSEVEIEESLKFLVKKKSRSRHDSSSENDVRDEERVLETRRGRKGKRGIERIARKRRNRRNRDRTSRFPSGSRERRNGRAFEKSVEIVTTRNARDGTRKFGKILSGGTSAEKRNNRKIGGRRKEVSKNDYEDSDIDESLFVDPTTDLPQSLLGTIDQTIDLTRPQFDITQDLNLDPDESLSSTLENFERDSSSGQDDTDAAKIVKSVGGHPSTASEEKHFTRKVHSQSSSRYIGKERRSSRHETIFEDKDKDEAEKIVAKSRAIGLTLVPDNRAPPRGHRYRCGKTVPERRRRSADLEDRRTEKTLPEKRRRSADDAIVSARRTTWNPTLQSGVGRENPSSEASGRVTRLSTRNSIANKENNGEKRAIGTIVWGNCKGWWPAFVVDPVDVGMFSQPDKTWVCWFWEYRISHLREKTQIQSFSNCLRERMIETLAGSKQNSRDPFYRACLETIELINDEILELGPLTKPYDAWATKHLASLENIDRLILHPYPPGVKTRLDELCRANCKATEKYLSELKASAEKITATKSTSVLKSVVKNAHVPMPGHLPLIKQKPGVITWAKIMGQVWWPAVIVDYRDCGMKEPSFGCQWILWYGDNTMSQVNHRFFLSFENGVELMKEYVKNCKRECYRRGVVDAARDYCSRYGYKTEEWSVDDVFEWFETNDEENCESSRTMKNSLPGIPGNSEFSQSKYPTGVVEALRKHRGNCTVAAAREHAIEEREIVRRLEACETLVEELCLMCLKDCDDNEKGIKHPFFVGKLCEECSEKYKPTVFAYGDDGKCFFCTICAGSDTVVMCDEDDCPRVYCTACIKYLVAPQFYEDIMHSDPWRCFVCDLSEDFTRNGFFKPRQDWKERVSCLFRSSVDSVPNQLELYNKCDKRKIRVLSLFDGISAGLVVLKKLGIQIEVYYASEIDPDAEMVSSAHHGPEIQRLGDVRSVSETKIREIVPIDLLIGGSPCNDLSLVNPLRLGLHDPNGTGILFFEYCRIKKLLEKHNGEHFFWLFENVASMPSKYRTEINEHLGREPALIDSANYSPQHRPRLYWSNLPIVSFPLSNQDLQDVLTPNCNRQALVKKIRTVTTRVNSLRQGRDALKPILMNEANDTLWITELEEIFGFPKHYTDVKNLCATKRQKLIAMSWSVQTIMEIMRPLCNFFYNRNDEAT